jgi:hypothetical protein
MQRRTLQQLSGTTITLKLRCRTADKAAPPTATRNDRQDIRNLLRSHRRQGSAAHCNPEKFGFVMGPKQRKSAIFLATRILRKKAAKLRTTFQ